MPQESLKNKTVKGIGWSAVDNVAQHIVTFVVGIVLARLLSPDDYINYGLPLIQLIAYTCLSVLTIFVVCTILDRLRLKAVEEPLFRWWDGGGSVNLEKS